MINLSSQLTGIELVTSQAKRGKKRVRFCLPEGDLGASCVKNGDYRRREAGEYLPAKRLAIKCSNRPTTDIDFDEEKEAGPKSSTSQNGSYMFDIHEDNIILVKRRKVNKYDNVNTNCAIKGDTSSKKKDTSKRPSKSNECLSPKKMKADNGGFKDDSCNVKYMLADKQKVSDGLKDVKAMEGKGLKQNKSSKKNDTRKNGSSSKSLCDKYKHSTLSKKHKPKCHKKSTVKVKPKQTKDKLKKTNDAKRKSLIKRASLQCKKALKQKQKLKHKLAQKRKLAKKRRVKEKRKIKIIPIEREEDVSECLRINLLKFMTFEKAYEHKLDCCQRQCWDNWNDLDIDDVIADFD